MDYEKAYKDAVSKIKSIIADKKKQGLTNCLLEGDLNEIFTELKESEDERIKKAIRNHIVGYDPNNEILIKEEGISEKQMLAWLEKQGEKSTIIDIDKMVKEYSQTRDGNFELPMNCMIRAYRKGINDALRLSLNLEKQGEESDYNPYKATIESISAMIEKYANGDLKDFYDNIKVKCKDAMEYDNTWNEKQGEQNPKFRIGDTIKKESTGDIVTISEIDLKNREYRLSNTGFIPFKYEYLWELVEQKPVWSEEDEDAIGLAIEALEDLCDADYPADSFIGHNLSFYEAVKRLKVLKPQPHWKPTEEQIEAVKCVAKDVFEFSSRSEDLRLKNEPYFKSLYSLYEQLKKL